MRIAVLGLPGSGKGTQAARLASRFGLPHLEAGYLLRQAVQAGVPLGREAAPYLARGLLVPSPLTIQLVFQHLNGLASFVLDGFPRTLVEAQELERFLKGCSLSLVLLLEAPPFVLHERLAGRLVCTRCQQVYHVRFHPPPAANPCPCGGELVHRRDDRPDLIQRRLDEQRRPLEAVATFYRQRGILQAIDAADPIDGVTERMIQAVEERVLVT